MGFVRTPEEVTRLQGTMAAPKALDGEMISIEFRTRPEIVERLLPPGLKRAPEPTGFAYVGRWARSNAGAFAGAGLYLRARHGDLEGDYCLAMPISTESALFFGREILGEPKKLCSILFEREGNEVRGVVARAGRSLITLEATLVQELSPRRFATAAFHYKYSHRVDGRGLVFDPLLVRMEIEHDARHFSAGSGSLRLGDTGHDPLAEIEILETGPAFYAQGDLRGSARVLASVSADAFLPYAYAKMDDWTLLDNEDDRSDEPASPLDGSTRACS